MTYPLEFRRHVQKVQQELKLNDEETAKRFCIGINSVRRWRVRVEPCLKRNCPAKKIDMQALEQDVKEHPDSYEYERAQRFGVSRSGIHAALVRLRVTRKKKSEPPQGG